MSYSTYEWAALQFVGRYIKNIFEIEKEEKINKKTFYILNLLIK